ncbi:MAG: ABC transporter ATP-binding protein [Oscillospiraceae bacterium]|nr:ABC transporter ATP-binding protein [Oscillospiraceae bacterium]MDY6208081.1 ABC transporter ATP-binding protein [Oscillospiraceae bacterium]
MKQENLLEIKNLQTDFMTVRGIVYAVQGVNIEVKKGEIHGIVGESGCGKSVTAKSVIRLHNEDHTRYSGEILWGGEKGETDILKMNRRQLAEFRGNDAAMIFQDPMTSLNPIMKAGEQIAEMLRKKKHMSRQAAKEEVISIFEKIGITPSEKRYEQYPFEMSGGMLQRIMIAMALSCKPNLLIADEPTTALDVTIQAQILRLIKELQRETGMTVVIITHNLGVVAEICDSVTVMYAGGAVESGSVGDIFDRPSHPYTKALLESNPKEADTEKRMKSIAGSPPLLYEKFSACPFAPRCSYSGENCRCTVPQTVQVGEGHYAACLKWKKVMENG